MQEEEMVELINKETATLEEVGSKVFNLNFGIRSRATVISEHLRVAGQIVRTEVTCGCTTPTVSNDIVTIDYNSNRLGVINQMVTLHMGDGSRIKINVLGTVS